MIGCAIVGGLVLLGVAKAIHRHRSYGYVGGCGGGWQRRGCHGHDHFPEERSWGHDSAMGGSWSPRWFVQHLLNRLQTSPSQSRGVTEAFETFASEMNGLRGEGKRTRVDLANALRKPAFDAVLLGELYGRHDETIEKGRKALVGLMDQLHSVLEDEQRQRLADLIEKGPQFWRHRGSW